MIKIVYNFESSENFETNVNILQSSEPSLLVQSTKRRNF